MVGHTWIVGAVRSRGNGVQAGVQVQRRLKTGLPLSKELEFVAYRVAQEALTNVARHADAHRIDLELEFTGEQTVLNVRDDGCGLSSAALASSNGMIGASLSIGGHPAGGTEVRLSVPLDTGSPR